MTLKAKGKLEMFNSSFLPIIIERSLGDIQHIFPRNDLKNNIDVVPSAYSPVKKTQNLKQTNEQKQKQTKKNLIGKVLVLNLH